MSILTNLTSIKIRATYAAQGVGFLDNVKLETASRGIAGTPAHWVESCECPDGTAGLPLSTTFTNLYSICCRLCWSVLRILRSRFQTFPISRRTVHALHSMRLQQTCRYLRVRNWSLHLSTSYYGRQLRTLRSRLLRKRVRRYDYWSWHTTALSGKFIFRNSLRLPTVRLSKWWSLHSTG